MLENFVILHKNGECLFQKTYAGSPLPLNIIVGLSSTLSMLGNIGLGTHAKAKAVGLDTLASKDASSSADAGSTSSTSSSTTSTDASSATSSSLSSTGVTSTSSASTSSSTTSSSTSGSSASTTSSSSAWSVQPPTGSDRIADPVVAVIHSYKVAVAEIGPYSLIAQASAQDNSAFLGAIVSNVQQMLLFYLGPFLRVPDDPSLLNPLSDLIDSYLSGYLKDVAQLVHAPRRAHIDARMRQQVDRILAAIEDAESITSTCLFLGSTVLHARMPARSVFWLSKHLATRPLHSAKLRAFPFSVGGKWQNALLVKFRNMTLAVTAAVRVPFSSLLPFIQDLEDILVESALPLPEETPPLLLRHFTNPDTLLFLLHHHASNIALSPPPRAGPASQHETVISTFHHFFSRACAALAPGTVGDVSLASQGFRFIAQVRDTYSFYGLFSDKLDTAGAERAAAEIIHNAATNGTMDVMDQGA